MNRNLYLKVVTIFFAATTYICSAQTRQISGKVIDSISSTPLMGVTIQNGTQKTVSDANGLFSIALREDVAVIFTILGYHRKIVVLSASDPFPVIDLQPAANLLDEVEVANTGYQKIPLERVTGSFSVINQKLLDRVVSTNVLNRIENVVPGLLFNKGDAAQTDPFLIRGRSTITADAQPLIVVDDFPYDGDIRNLNPNDFEQVSILKDAAAASIWGARAANGVIVITTKRGQFGAPTWTFTANTSLQGRPDLNNVSIMSSADRVEWERMLFEQGYYNNAKNPTTLLNKVSPIPGAVELMIKNPADLEERLSELKKQDVRDDLKKYFYQTSLKQQYNLSISGRGKDLSYLLSGGYDRNSTNLNGEQYERVSIRSQNNYQLTGKINIFAGMAYTESFQQTGENPGLNLSPTRGLSPYVRLIGNQGEALPYYGDYRKGFLDTAGSGLLQDWVWRPYDEITLRENKSHVRDMTLNTGLEYQVLPGLDLILKYQYENQLEAGKDLHSENSYYARDMVNRFAQVSAESGSVAYPLPMGGILQENNSDLGAHQGRLQFNFMHHWGVRHEISGLAGYEIRNKVTQTSNYLLYGYRAESAAINSSVDFQHNYPSNINGNTTKIPNSQGIGKQTDHFISYFANAAYTYLKRYTLSASLRKDEANLFGVAANQKGTPLWSSGIAWRIDEEKFYSVSFLPRLKLRATYGINGNISRRSSANTTVIFLSGGDSHSFTAAQILNPPNKNLRWEKVKNWNVGIDFSSALNRVSGTIELYRKNAVDLLAEAPTDPTMGFTSIYANVGGMKGSGMDILLESQNIKGWFSWRSNLIFSIAKTEVTKYLMPVSSNGFTYAASGMSVMPVVGKSLYSIYSYSWAGLDPQDGDPQFFLNNSRSKDYPTIYSLPLEDMQYNGPVQPTHFGALRNTFSLQNMELSFNISFKAGNFFRVNSIYNSGIINGSTGHGDFGKRWLKPGDELKTTVPSMIYPADPIRDQLYQYASSLVAHADEIRFDDLNISYAIDKKNLGKIRVHQARVFIYLSQLGMIWASNKAGIDPDFNNVPKEAPTFSLGLNIKF
ncbi:TonB-linked outer membrane protein, SusC/RagA family [bacterium A37T11]|nr:TonB-linked outer membrane protein, SusC/RagA family [bacterium A37T11]